MSTQILFMIYEKILDNNVLWSLKDTVTVTCVKFSSLEPHLLLTFKKFILASTLDLWMLNLTKMLWLFYYYYLFDNNLVTENYFKGNSRNSRWFSHEVSNHLTMITHLVAKLLVIMRYELHISLSLWTQRYGYI